MQTPSWKLKLEAAATKARDIARARNKAARRDTNPKRNVVVSPGTMERRGGQYDNLNTDTPSGRYKDHPALAL